MKKIEFNIERYQEKKTTITNQRQEVVKQFVDILNEDRVKNGYKTLSSRFYAIRMSAMSLDQLRAFYGYCREGKSFSKTWWYKTNPKNY